MSKNRKEIGLSAQARHEQMLAYVLADAFELAWTDHEESLKREGFKVAFSTSQAAGAIRKGFREIHRVERGDSRDETDREVQRAIGTMGDIALAIVALMIDRCDSDTALFKLYNFIKLKFPSKVGMDLNKYERNAFNEL